MNLIDDELRIIDDLALLMLRYCTICTQKLLRSEGVLHFLFNNQ